MEGVLPTRENQMVALKCADAMFRVNKKMSKTRYKSLSIDQRLDVVEEKLVHFNLNSLLKDAFENHPTIKLKDARNVYFHFLVSMDDFIDVTETKNPEKLRALLVEDGFQVSQELHAVLSVNAFADYAKDMLKSSRSETVYVYFSCEIFLSDDRDVKRTVGILKEESPTNITRDDFVRQMRKKQPDFDMTEEAFEAFTAGPGLKLFYEKMRRENPVVWLNAMQTGMEALRTCNFCKVRTFSLPKCPCKQIYYCGADCQNKDWKVHKKICTRGK